jgi:hypothetical protein
METMKLQKKVTPASAMLDPKILVPAIGSRLRQARPAADDQEPGDVRGRVVAALTTVIFCAISSPAAAISASRSRSSSGCGSRCCSPISPKPSPKAAARRRPNR